ncbi:MAG TPA: HsdR family type I site-specific deoxyribonuclease [Thermodesulfobacteriota bacterium]
MRFTESKLVEDYVIRKLEEKGWNFVPADELQRDSYEEHLFIPNLSKALERINEKAGIGEEEINRVKNELKLTGTGHEGAKRILNFYKFGVPVKFEKEKVVKYVQLFDFEDINNNEFIVTRQVYFYGKDKIRTDIILYVNGIPVVNIECKNPTSLSESWESAYKQIKDYEDIVPELYKYIQIGVAAESEAKYFPIVPWQEEVKIYEWKVEGKDSIDSTIEVLSRENLLDILRNFLFYRVEFGNASKVITRYMQLRASNKMVDRVIKNLKGVEEKNKGLIWHWQGSGKTLTMIFAANKLYYSKELENPSIFFIVDRIDLEDQLYGEFYSLEIVRPEIIGSVERLKDVLSFDDYRGKRGIFILLIHKFRPDELKELENVIEEVSNQKETILNRKNVIAFIDEGHRTQYGLFGAQRKSIFRNAFSFALTGTPISKRGKDTYEEFSYPPEEPYLDRYFITDSIRDKFTLKIVYQPRLEKDVHLKKDMLEVFLETELEELPEDIRGDVEEKIRKKLNAIKVILENPERIRVIAEDIANHFKENIEGKFKAMVVAGNRTACAIYKTELDKHLPKDYSEVVMTHDERREKDIRSTVLREARARYGDMEPESLRRKIRESFIEEEIPKILIVTDMLLAGFDAPILQVMYLDKPLKEHKLLQAVARTNRPYKDLKGEGVVIDYIGVLKDFKKALEIYSEDDIKGALFSYDSLKEEFIILIKEVFEILKGIPKNYDRDTLLKTIEHITSDEEIEKEFTDKYRGLRKLFELLGPNEIKLEYFEAYKWLSAIYTYYMKTVMKKPSYDGYVKKYYDKTVRFIHKSTEIEELEAGLPVIEFDENYLQKLEEKVKSKEEKAANILFTLNRLVLVERHSNPIYESLVEKVERLLRLWKEKTKDYERLYSEGVELLNHMKELSNRQRGLNFSNLAYSMLLILEDKFGSGDGLVNDVRNLYEKLEKYTFPGWSTQTTVTKEVEREVRRFVRAYKKKYSLSFDDMNHIYDKLMESVKNYGAA